MPPRGVNGIVDKARRGERARRVVDENDAGLICIERIEPFAYALLASCPAIHGRQQQVAGARLCDGAVVEVAVVWMDDAQQARAGQCSSEGRDRARENGPSGEWAILLGAVAARPDAASRSHKNHRDVAEIHRLAPRARSRNVPPCPAFAGAGQMPQRRSWRLRRKMSILWA